MPALLHMYSSSGSEIAELPENSPIRKGISFSARRAEQNIPLNVYMSVTASTNKRTMQPSAAKGRTAGVCNCV